MQKIMVVAGLLMSVVSPALAAEFYLAQDPSTKKCKILDAKPDGTTMIMLGTSSYATREEAKAAKKTFAECPKKPKPESPQ